MKIYKDINDAGESYTVYVDGKCVASDLLSDDVFLCSIPSWEQYVVAGLDNRS